MLWNSLLLKAYMFPLVVLVKNDRNSYENNGEKRELVHAPNFHSESHLTNCLEKWVRLSVCILES